MEAYGPASISDRSTTRSPSSGPGISHQPAPAGPLEYGLEDSCGRGVDHDAVETGGTLSPPRRLPDSADDAGSVFDLLGGRGEHLVGGRHLVWVDAPFPDRTERGSPGGLQPAAVRVAEVGVRPVDRVQAVSPGSDDRPVAGVVPHVSRIGRRKGTVRASANTPGADALARGQVTDAEDQRLDTRGAACDVLDA